MNISKSSWHYRYVNKWWDWPARNLCPYVWQIVLTTLLFPICTATAGTVAFSLTSPLWFWYVDNEVLRAVGILGAMLDIGILFFIWHEYRDEYWTFKGSKIYHDDMLPGLETPKSVTNFNALVRAWLKARHDQVCPLIDFVEDKS